MKPEYDEIEIDLKELLYVLKQKLIIILAVTAICGIAGALVTCYAIEPKYSSTSKIYVMNKSDSALSFADLNLSTGLTADYVELIESRPVMEQVIKNLKLSMTYEELLDFVKITNPADTRMLNITVTYTDALVAENIANNIVTVAREQISKVMKTDAPSVVEEAISTGKKVSPSNTKNTLLAAAIGCILTCGVIILLHIMDDSVKNMDDVERYLGLNTLAVIPDDMDGVKGKNKKSKLRFGRKED